MKMNEILNLERSKREESENKAQRGELDLSYAELNRIAGVKTENSVIFARNGQEDEYGANKARNEQYKQYGSKLQTVLETLNYVRRTD